jgi:hypothetical protein
MALTDDPRLPCFRGQSLQIVPCLQASSEQMRLDLMQKVIGFLTSKLHQRFAFRHILKAHLQPNKKTGARIVEAHIGDSLDERQIVHRAASGALDKTWKCEWACRLPPGQWAYLNDVTSTVHGSVLQKATMRVSSAFAPGDGIVIWGEGVSIWKETASRNACTEAFAYLMVEDAARHPEQSRVLLHQIHWKMPLADLLAQVRSLHSLATTGASSAGQPVAPVPVSASGDDDKGEPAQRGSVECVGEYLMKEHRNARHRIRHAAPEQVRALRSVRKKRSLLEGTLRREETSNWRQRELWEDIEFGQRELQAAEINSILKEHDGEVRVWQRRSEVWKPQIIDKFRTLSIYYGK